MKILLAAIGLLCAVGLSVDAWAECRILTTTDTYSQGELTDNVCDTNASQRSKTTTGSVTGLETSVAGERLQDQVTKSYLEVRQAANASIISKTTAVTIGGGVASDTHLMGIMIHTALTGTCVITGFADSDGTVQSYTLPVASVGYKDFLGALNSAGALSITCSNAGDDNLVLVLWRPAS